MITPNWFVSQVLLLFPSVNPVTSIPVQDSPGNSQWGGASISLENMGYSKENYSHDELERSLKRYAYRAN
jgi:hypothetical protein